MRTTLLCTLALVIPVAAGESSPPKRDLYGDPLPDGAVMRLGTSRHRFPGATLQFAPDGKSIVAVQWGRYVSRLDAKTGLVTEKFTLPVEDARCAYLFPDGRRALIVRRSRPHHLEDVSEVWDLDRKARVTTVQTRSQWMWPLAFSPRGDRFATSWVKNDGAEQEFTCGVFDCRTGEVITIDQSPKSSNGSNCILSPTFSSDGSRVLHGVWTNGEYRLRCLALDGKGERWDRVIPSDGPAGPFQMPDGRFLLRVGDKWQSLAANSGDAREVKGPPATMWSTVTFAGDVSLSWNTRDAKSRLCVWDWKADRPRSESASWDIGDAAGGSLIPAPDGKSVLIDGSVAALIDLESGKLRWGGTTAAGHTGTVNQIRFSAEGTRLASAAEDGTVRVWDVQTGRQLRRCEARGQSTGAPDWYSENGSSFGASGLVPMDLSPDGRLLALAQSPTEKEPFAIRVAEVDTGYPVASRRLPLGPAAGGWPELPGSLAFSADGRAIMTTFGLSSWESVLAANHTTARWDFRSDRWGVLGQGEPAPIERTAVGRSRAVRFTYGKGFSTRTGREAIELAGGGLGPMALSSSDRLVAGVGRPTNDRQPASNWRIRDLRVWDARTGELIATLAWEPPATSRSTWTLFHNPAPPVNLGWAWPRSLSLDQTGRLLATVDLFGVRLWDVATGRVVRTVLTEPRPHLELYHGRPAGVVAFTPDGSHLAVGMHDGTILFWPVPTLPPNPPRADELPALWADLAGQDAAKGWRAAWRLMDDPAAAVKLIRENLTPAERIPAAEVAKLLSDVDSPEFRRREVATRRLEAVVDQVRPALEEAVKAAGASAELRERLHKVLAAAPDDDKPLPPRAAAQSRVVAVLEHVRTPGGSAALRELAGGAPGAWLTREAEAALARLATRKP